MTSSKTNPVINGTTLEKWPSAKGHVTIPDGITEIGDNAFNGCTKLTGVTIPNSVTRIGERAFYKCTGLTGLVIPDSVEDIDTEAFYGFTGLTGVVLPSVDSLGSKSFFGCGGVTCDSLPKSVLAFAMTGFNSAALYDKLSKRR